MPLSEEIKISQLFETDGFFLGSVFSGHEYPWQLLPSLKEYLLSVISRGIEGYTEIKKGVLVGEGVEIHRLSEIMAPAIIGSGSEIRIGAFIRGDVIIGEGCVIGNSCEIKNSLLMNRVQVPHYNYVGDSVLGNRSHLGAGSICSNLKNDGRSVVIHAEREYNSGMRKLGAILGDGANVGCGCVLNPGTVIGRNTDVYPQNSLRGVFPSDSIVKSSENIAKKEPRI